MRISVVTPSYNHARFIERTIQSVLSQEGNFELDLFISDGGSTDGTLDILGKYEGRLRYVSERDGGPTDAFAKGLRATDGEIIGWLCSDDLFCPGALQKVKEAFERHPEALWVVGKCRIVDVNDRETRKLITAYKNWWLRRYSYKSLLVVNYISAPAVFFRRSAVKDVGLPDDEFEGVVDYVQSLKLGLKTEPVVLDEYLACFRGYFASRGGSDPRLHMLNEYKAALKYNPGYWWVRPLHWIHTWSVIVAYRMMWLWWRLRHPIATK